MNIKCYKSGGFTGQIKSCDLNSEEFDPNEAEAFKEVQRNTQTCEENRDSYIYHFLFLEENMEKEVVIDETLINEKMLPIIKKVNERLR